MKKHLNEVLSEWREKLREEKQKTWDQVKTKGECYAETRERA